MSNLLTYREKQNMTQDELAEKSGVSVRTIQRVEAGANLKGHTLKALAQALNISTTNLDAKVEEIQYNIPLIKLINLSSLLFFVPLANIFIPVLIMYLTKEKNPITNQIVSLQIMWTIISLVAFLLSPFIQKWFSLNRQLILVVLIVCILINIFIILRNGLELDKNKKLRFRLKFSII